jgi:hypothetical protein
MPVIPAAHRLRQENQEMEAWARGMAQLVEHLPSKCKAQSSNSRVQREKERQRERERERERERG